MQKTVDVVIPTYHPGDSVILLLKGLLRQRYPVEKIWIMNTEEKLWNHKLDGLSEKIVVEHIAKKEFDHGGTRHRGIIKSRADIVICMTQDALPFDDKLTEELVRALEPEGVMAAYARQLPRPDCRFLERYTRAFNYPSKSRVKWKRDLKELGIKTYFCSNVCAAYDREMYLERGGFTKRTIFNEDMIFAAGLIEAGYGVAYVADAKVIHSHNYSGREQLHRNFDLAVSQADHPEVFLKVRSESEGIRMVKQTAGVLAQKKKFYLIPELIWQSGMKYIGYRLGRKYKKLPRWMVTKLTMNREYWNY